MNNLKQKSRLKRNILLIFISQLLISCGTTTTVLNKKIEFHKNTDKILSYEYELKKIKTPDIIDKHLILSVMRFDIIEVTETEVVTTLTKQFGLDDIRKDSYKNIGVYPQRSDSGISLKNVVFEINIGGTVKNIYSKGDGEIRVDLVEDFGLSSFDIPTEIRVKISCKSINFTETLILNSSDWTIPYVRITQDELFIYNEEEGKLLEKGIAFRGMTFRIEFENDQLFRIKFGNEPAFVPRQAGIKFWSVSVSK